MEKVKINGVVWMWGRPMPLEPVDRHGNWSSHFIEHCEGALPNDYPHNCVLTCCLHMEKWSGWFIMDSEAEDEADFYVIM